MSSTILVVDDSDNDVLLLQKAFELANCPFALVHVDDGRRALSYLRAEGEFADRQRFPLPVLVLLDLNMPQSSGFEVLTWIREQPLLRRLPIFILSASSREMDVCRAWDLGISAYLVKPGNLNQLVALAGTIHSWTAVNTFAPLSR